MVTGRAPRLWVPAGGLPSPVLPAAAGPGPRGGPRRPRRTRCRSSWRGYHRPSQTSSRRRRCRRRPGTQLRRAASHDHN